MANSKISDLPSRSTLDGTEQFPLDQASTTVKASLDDIKAYTNNGVATSYTMSFNFSSVPSVIPVNSKCLSVVPVTGTITKAVLHGQGSSGSAEIDILMASTPANIPTATSITGAENLILTTDYSVVLSIPIAWTEVVTENDFLLAEVVTTDLTQLTIILTITPT